MPNKNFTYLDDEIIIDSDFQTNNQKIVYEETQKFSLRDFFKGKGASSGADIIITPNQMIATDAFASGPDTPKFGTHLETAKIIYQAIYGNKPPLMSYDSQIETIDWQELITEDDNILIQLCDPKASPSIIWLPSSCSENQIKFLEQLDREIKTIKIEDPEYFKKNPIIFECMYNGVELCTINDLNLFIDSLWENARRDEKPKKQGGIKWDNLQNKN